MKSFTRIELTKLKPKDTDKLLELEEEMYWKSGKWSELWIKEAKGRFRTFIKDYLTNFPQGCFGIVDERDTLLGGMFLLKTSKLEPIPYLHRFPDYFSNEGNIAYVSFFVVKRGEKEEETAQKLYEHAEEVALLKIKCKKIAVVIYSSPLEEKVLKGNNFEKSEKQFNWEIYPGKMVPCRIYSYDILMEKT